MHGDLLERACFRLLHVSAGSTGNPLGHCEVQSLIRQEIARLASILIRDLSSMAAALAARAMCGRRARPRMGQTPYCGVAPPCCWARLAGRFCLLWTAHVSARRVPEPRAQGRRMSLTLSCREQVAIAACSDTLVRPLDFPTLDAWRIAVLDVFSGLIAVDAAFFNFRRPPDGSAIALSREFTGATVRHYEQTCVNDAGFERALERRLSAMNQTMLIGGEWDLYYSDPAVCEFYLPNKVLDSLGLILDEPSAGVSASVELHASRYGTRPFGPRGVALMQLLLPSFRAGLLAISRANAVRGQLASVLNAS